MIRSIKRLFLLTGEYKAQMIGSVILAIISVIAGLAPYFFNQPVCNGCVGTK